MSRDKHFWLYLDFYETYNIQTCQDGKHSYSILSLLQVMTWLPLAHMTQVYCFICTSLSPTTTKTDMMEEQHVLALPYGHVDVTTNMSHDQHLWLLFHFYKSYNTHVWS